MVEYRHESVDDVVGDIGVLLKNHYDEIATHKEHKILNPDFDKYRMLELNGMLRIFTARINDRLIGYFITFISPHLHYQDCMYAINDIVYLMPEHRGGTVAYKLFKYAIEDIKANTYANILCIHMKIDYPFRNLLKKLDFNQTEENWERVL